VTQGIVSIKRNGQMAYKIIVGHDGMHAADVALDVRQWFRANDKLPDAGQLVDICERLGFGCGDCIVILEYNPCKHNDPKMHTKLDGDDWDEEGRARYLDTFHVPQFNPRWKYGTADYVEVVEL
jgi:hypothetical protein